jgi:hypothetical protein
MSIPPKVGHNSPCNNLDYVKDDISEHPNMHTSFVHAFTLSNQKKVLACFQLAIFKDIVLLILPPIVDYNNFLISVDLKYHIPH